jgi:hypothetical protein
MAAQIELGHKHGGDCILCMCRPTNDHGQVEPMFTAVGVDVNWGENANICVVCAGVMADLLGRKSSEDWVKLVQAKRKLGDKVAEQEGKLAEQEELLNKIREGGKAQRKVRAA